MQRQLIELVLLVLGLDCGRSSCSNPGCDIKASIPASCCSQATSEDWIDPRVDWGAAVALGMQPPWGLAPTTLFLVLVLHIASNVALRVVSDLFEWSTFVKIERERKETKVEKWGLPYVTLTHTTILWLDLSNDQDIWPQWLCPVCFSLGVYDNASSWSSL